MEKIWIWDTHPGSATLLFGININTFTVGTWGGAVRLVACCFTAGNRTRHKLVQESNMIRLCLKGQCYKMDIFVEVINILISTICVCADGFQGLTTSFHYPTQSLTFYLLLWNYLLILNMLTETLLRIPFSVIGRKFSSADLIGCRDEINTPSETYSPPPPPRNNYPLLTRELGTGISQEDFPSKKGKNIFLRPIKDLRKRTEIMSCLSTKAWSFSLSAAISLEKHYLL